MKKIVTVAALAAVATLSGCAIGSGKFSCPGMPSGVTCMSVLDVYEKTSSGSPSATASQGSAEAHGHGQIDGRRPVNASVEPDRPVPVRTEPEVLRILIAPWEDTQENLFGGGYVFTELEKRKWNIGVREPMNNTHTLDSYFGQKSPN